MRFIGIFKHGRCEGVAATDAEAHAEIEAHPKLARAATRARSAVATMLAAGAGPDD